MFFLQRDSTLVNVRSEKLSWALLYMSFEIGKYNLFVTDHRKTRLHLQNRLSDGGLTQKRQLSLLTQYDS